MSFYDTLMEGNIMPSWAAGINATYGNPLFIFNYSLPYYIVSLFHFVGFSYIASMKIMLGSTFVLSGIFMYMAVKRLVRNDFAAFSAGVFYLFNPYHLVDFHFRATPGESTLFMIGPLLLYFVISFLQSKKYVYLIGISLTTILLSLSHPMVSITVHGIVILFALTYAKNINKTKLLVPIFIALCIGFLGSLYVWLPFVIFSEYQLKIPSGTHYFSPLIQLIYSEFKFGLLFQGPNGELHPPIGYSQLIVVLLAFFIVLKKLGNKQLRNTILTMIIIFFILIILVQQYSDIFWKRFETLWMLEGRLLLPMAFCTSIIAGIVFFICSKRKTFNKYLYIFLFLTILSTILNWGHRRVILEIDDNWLRNNIVGSTAYLEGQGVWFANTKWADKNQVWFDQLPKQHLEIIGGNGTIKELSRNTTKHTYIINALTPILVKENTLWYPGWKLTSNKKTIYIYPGKAGVINAKLNPGLQYLEFSYDDILSYKIFKLLSFGIFSTLIILLSITLLFSNPKNFPWNQYKPNFFNTKKKFKKQKK